MPAWQEVEFGALDRTVLLPRGMQLDLGGIGKGWAADRAAGWLGAIGPSLVDAGGDIAVSGPMSGDSPWPIGVADPRVDETCPDEQQDGQIVLLGISSGGVATSGRDYRRWRHNGRDVHHIIDPRTGAPARTDVLSATVVAPGAAIAEAAAKAVLILGSMEGLRWLEARSELAALLVLEDGSVLRSPSFGEYIWGGESQDIDFS